MEQTLVKKPAMMLIGIECRTSNANDAAPIDIPRQWEKFYRENVFHQIPNKASQDVIALYCDYEGDYTQPYSFVLGCQTTSMDDIPAGMVAKFIPESNYGLFKAIGDFPKSLIETWGKIWQTELQRTYSNDFEIYGEKFHTGSPKEVDVFIGIET